jgi:hypothetical protein
MGKNRNLEGNSGFHYKEIERKQLRKEGRN